MTGNKHIAAIGSDNAVAAKGRLLTEGFPDSCHWFWCCDDGQLTAIKRQSRPSAIRQAILQHGIHLCAKTCLSLWCL